MLLLLRGMCKRALTLPPVQDEVICCVHGDRGRGALSEGAQARCLATSDHSTDKRTGTSVLYHHGA
jgi:hypothetical protein